MAALLGDWRRISWRVVQGTGDLVFGCEGSRPAAPSGTGSQQSPDAQDALCSGHRDRDTVLLLFSLRSETQTMADFTTNMRNSIQSAGILQTAGSREIVMSTFTHDPDALGANVLSVALIGPAEQRRKAVASALAGSQASVTREFPSYPEPGRRAAAARSGSMTSSSLSWTAIRSRPSTWWSTSAAIAP